MTSNVRIFLVLTLMAASFILVMDACRKDRNSITVRGTVFDPNTNANVEGALVVLSANKITSGTYSSGFEEIGRIQTAGDGNFEFNFEEEKAGSYRIYISKSGYFQHFEEISTEEINPETDYYSVFNFYPIGYIKLFVKNAIPFDGDDHISYSFTSGHLNCSECCSNSLHSASGMFVDDTMKCKTYGNQNVTITWNVNKNNQMTLHSGSVYCHAFDTVEYHIFY